MATKDFVVTVRNGCSPPPQLKKERAQKRQAYFKKIKTNWAKGKGIKGKGFISNTCFKIRKKWFGRKVKHLERSVKLFSSKRVECDWMKKANSWARMWSRGALAEEICRLQTLLLHQQFSIEPLWLHTLTEQSWVLALPLQRLLRWLRGLQKCYKIHLQLRSQHSWREGLH